MANQRKFIELPKGNIKVRPFKIQQRTLRPYMLFDGVFNKQEIKDILEKGRKAQEQVKITKAGKLATEVPQKLLDGAIDTTLPENDWIGTRIEKFIMKANRYYRFDVVGMQANVRVLEYGVDDHMDWHDGITFKPLKLLSSIGLVRDNLVGGELDIFSLQNTWKGIDKQQGVTLNPGQMVVYPAWAVHRVRPVISGRRVVLGVWTYGLQFK